MITLPARQPVKGRSAGTGQLRKGNATVQIRAGGDERDQEGLVVL